LYHIGSFSSRDYRREFLTFYTYFTFDRIKTFKLKNMRPNVGSTDRVIRIVIGLGIAIGGVIFESYWGLIGVVILATGVYRFSLVYKLLNITTNKEVEEGNRTHFF
jgi:hypothetical protein